MSTFDSIPKNCPICHSELQLAINPHQTTETQETEPTLYCEQCDHTFTVEDDN